MGQISQLTTNYNYHDMFELVKMQLITLALAMTVGIMEIDGSRWPEQYYTGIRLKVFIVHIMWKVQGGR